MPRRLLDRCQPDSIREFRLSAQRRYEDGLTALISGRRLAAMYLWGYSAEMILKASYFAAVGVVDTQPLQMPTDITPAIHLGRWLGIVWPHQGQGHNVRAWAELLVMERITNPNPPPSYNGLFEQEIQRSGQRISELWNETLRYRKNQPYEYEVRQVRQATEWLLTNSADL